MIDLETHFSKQHYDYSNAAARVLKPGGTIIVIETIVSSIVEFFEKLFYPASAVIFGLLKMPMVYMLAQDTILRFIRDSGFKDIHCKKISYGKKMDIFAAIKPGLLVIPTWMVPHRCYFFIAYKPKFVTTT